MKGIITRLDKAQQQWQGAIGWAENQIYGKVEFDFGIEYQPSDGWCLLEIDCSNLAPLDSCLAVIKDKGFLSIEDFKSLMI